MWEERGIIRVLASKCILFDAHGVCRRAYILHACVRFYMLHSTGGCLLCLLRVANDCSSLAVLASRVESSMSPVGLGVDSCIRMLAGGCRRGSPGVFPSPNPLSGRGVAH